MPLNTDTTFESWLDEIIGSPKSIKEETVIALKKKYERYWMLLAKANPSADITDADIISAFTEGPEALTDLQGVTSTISLKKLYENPYKTIKALAESTKNDIFNLDELASDRRTEMATRLMKGYVTDGDGSAPDSKYRDTGTRLDRANNVVLRGLHSASRIPLSLIYPIDPGTGKSTIQLVVDKTNGTDPKGIGEWEDRRVVEENIQKQTYHKSYMGLSTAVAGLAASMESTNPRLALKNDAYFEYGRVIAQELGTDLDLVLNTSDNGYLAVVLDTDLYTEKFDNTTGRWKRVRIDDAQNATKGFLGWDKSGDVARGKFSDKRLKGSSFTDIGILHKTLAENAGGDIEVLVANPNLMAKALNIDPADFVTFTPETQSFYKEFLRAEELRLRKSFIGIGETGLSLQKKWEQAGLTKTLRGRDYSDELSETWLIGDLDHCINQTSNRLFLSVQKSQPQLMAMLPKQIEQEIYNSEFKKQKAKIYANEMTKANRGGYTPLSTAQIELKAKANASAYVASKASEITDKTDRAIKRLKSATEAVNIASDLYATATFKEFFENVQSGSLVKSLIVLSRAYGSMPDSPVWLRSTAQWTNFADPDVVKNKIDRAIYHSNVFRYNRYTPIPGDETSVFGLLKKIESAGLHQKTVNTALVNDISISDLLNHPDKLADFYAKLEEAKKFALANPNNPLQGTPLDGYIEILDKMGLLQKDSVGKYYLDYANENYTAFLKTQTKILQWANPVTVLTDRFTKNILHYTGVQIDAKKTAAGLNPVLNTLNKATFGQLESSMWLDWAVTDSTGRSLGYSTFRRVQAKNMAGLFENNGVFQMLDILDQKNILVKRLGAGAPTVESLFENFDKLDDLYKNLKDAGEAYKQFLLLRQTSGATVAAKHIPSHLKPYISILKDLNLLNTDQAGKFLFETVFANYDKFIGPTGAKTTLLALSSGKNALLSAKRWELVKRMYSSKRHLDIIFKGNLQLYSGLLKNYNNYSNMLRNYLIKNVIFGQQITSIPGIGKIYKPIQELIKDLGFSDQLTLSQTVKNWRFVKSVTGFGAKLQSNPAILAKLTSQAFLKKILQSAIAKFGVKALGFILQAFAGFLSGGLSWAFTIIAGTLFKMGLKLLKFDLVGAGKVIAEDTKSFVMTIKKIVVYPFRLLISLVLSCVALPIGCIIIVAAIAMPASIAPLQKMSGAVRPPDQNTQSEMVQVTKIANKTDWWLGKHTSIEYTIKVTNLTTQELLIDEFSDSLFISWACGNNPLISYFGETSFVGNLDNQYDPSKILYQTLTPGGSLELKYKLKDITDKDATYTNEVQVSVAQDPGKYATSFASVQIGAGGCADCPAMSPVSIPPAYISACPGEIATHTGESAESIDYAASIGTPVYATFSGTAQSIISDTGYGNRVILTSPLGFYAIFAHLSVVHIPTTPTPVTNLQLIGEVGRTGNSTGPHLHYEFRTGGMSCQGRPLKMAPPFIPDLPAGSCTW